MAITATTLTSNHSATNATSYATASISPTAGSVQIAVICANQSFGSAHSATVSGWTEISTGPTFNTSYTIQAFWALTSGAQTITFNYGANSMTSAIWCVQEFAGVDAVAPIRNPGTVTGVAATSATPSITLGAFSSAANGTFGVFAQDGLTTSTPGTGFTELFDFQHSESFDNRTLTSEWRADNSTTVGVTFSGANHYGGVACELVAAAAGGDGTDMPWPFADVPILTPVWTHGA